MPPSLDAPRTLLVTGGAGFIGSAVVRHLLASTPHHVVSYDALTYAGSRDNLGPTGVTGATPSSTPTSTTPHASTPRWRTRARRRAPPGRRDARRPQHRRPGRVRAHQRAGDLHAARGRSPLPGTRTDFERDRFRFVHVSTDEVFGSLGAEGAFDTTSRYDPRSPYSASKAGSDHLARAWHHTYGLPVVVTNCSNNYGPYQYPEKLIPHVVLRALHGLPVPVYGEGRNVRDWLHVEDHARGLVTSAERGEPGATYLFGGGTERTSLEVVEAVCRALDELRPRGAPHARLIQFVADRPGHDFRYAVDAWTSAREGLGWEPRRGFEEGLRETVAWYLDNLEWCEARLGAGYGLERAGTAGPGPREASA
jgi:dTDP-glucose 4,6-dehydratase